MNEIYLFAGAFFLSLLLETCVVCLLWKFRRRKNDKKEVAETLDLIQHAARQDFFLNMVLGNIPCQVFIKDPLDSFKYKIANKNFLDYYRLKEENVIEHPDEDIFEPDVARQLRSHDQKVCADPGRIFRFDEDISFRRRGDEVFKSLKVCFETPDHHPYLLGICVDITDLSHLIQMERIDNELLTQCVAESSFQRVVELSSKTLAAELNCSRVIFLQSETKGSLKLFHEEYSPKLLPIAMSALEKHEKLWNDHWDRLANNELITYDDFKSIPGIDVLLKIFPDYRTKSIAGVPIIVENHLYGALLISYCEPHVFMESDKTMLRSMSKIITLAAIRNRQLAITRKIEEENQALLDNISIPLWLYDTQGHIIQTNRAADRKLGRIDRNESYDCRHLLNCKQNKVNCPIVKAMTLRKTAQERCSFHERNYMIEASPIINERTSSIQGVVSSFYDVTELETAILNRQSVNDCLTNLVRENDMHKAIQESIQDICEHLKATRCYIIQFDTETHTVSCFLEYSRHQTAVINQIQHKTYSKSVDWLQAFMDHPLLSFPTRQSLDNNPGLKSYRENFAHYNVQSVYAHRILLNGKVWGYVSALYEYIPHELTDSERDYIGSIASCIELMLVRQQYQENILSALRKAENADKAKSMFLASMSHEIRTPLNAVIGFADLLKGERLPRQTEADYLSAISDAGNSLLALINDVLDLSKLEAGQMIFTPSLVNLAELINEVGNIFQQKCHEKNLRFISDIPSDMPQVKIDKLRVRQILFNLIGNAVKFTNAGSITVMAKYEKTSSDRGLLTFSVTDTGIGISEEDQTHIFQMFVQGKALRGTQAERNGTGLGLAICKHMVEKMNGNLSLESTLGKGSVFLVVLNEIEWSNQSESELTIADKHKESLIERPLTVLVADDVAMNLKVISAMLNHLGGKIKTLTVSNAEEAWNTLEKNKVDFLLTDLWMPGMNGAELAAKIRRSGKYPVLTVVALTADVDGRENFDMSFFDAVLTKPLTIEKLKQFILEFEKKHE